jgi:SAM-dependent methyltransferase
VHNPKVLKFVQRWLPRWLRRRLDPFHIRIEDELRKFAGSISPGMRILDGGAGECPFRPWFKGAKYVAIDNAVGDESWDYSQLSAYADLTELPFADASFDAAINIVVLEHVAYPAKAIGEFRRVLRPGGRIFVAVPQVWELHQAPHDFFRYTRCGLELLLRDAGFEIEMLEPTGGYFELVGKLSIDVLQFFERGVLKVFWVLLAPVFGLAIPFVCYYLDKLDGRKDFAVGFMAIGRAARLPRVDEGSPGDEARLVSAPNSPA